MIRASRTQLYNVGYSLTGDVECAVTEIVYISESLGFQFETRSIEVTAARKFWNFSLLIQFAKIQHREAGFNLLLLLPLYLIDTPNRL